MTGNFPPVNCKAELPCGFTGLLRSTDCWVVRSRFCILVGSGFVVWELCFPTRGTAFTCVRRLGSAVSSNVWTGPDWWWKTLGGRIGRALPNTVPTMSFGSRSPWKTQRRRGEDRGCKKKSQSPACGRCDQWLMWRIDHARNLFGFLFVFRLIGGRLLCRSVFNKLHCRAVHTVSFS